MYAYAMNTSDTLCSEWEKKHFDYCGFPFSFIQCTVAPPQQTHAPLPTRNHEWKKRCLRVQHTEEIYKEVSGSRYVYVRDRRTRTSTVLFFPLLTFSQITVLFFMTMTVPKMEDSHASDVLSSWICSFTERENHVHSYFLLLFIAFCQVNKHASHESSTYA